MILLMRRYLAGVTRSSGPGSRSLTLLWIFVVASAADPRRRGASRSRPTLDERLPSSRSLEDSAREVALYTDSVLAPTRRSAGSGSSHRRRGAPAARRGRSRPPEDVPAASTIWSRDGRLVFSTSRARAASRREAGPRPSTTRERRARQIREVARRPRRSGRHAEPRGRRVGAAPLPRAAVRSASRRSTSTRARARRERSPTRDPDRLGRRRARVRRPLARARAARARGVRHGSHDRTTTSRRARASSCETTRTLEADAPRDDRDAERRGRGTRPLHRRPFAARAAGRARDRPRALASRRSSSGPSARRRSSTTSARSASRTRS